MARGATEYLVKPFSFDELTKVTRAIINLYKPIAG
jgi:DNA-binding response OmpR family regulator